MASPRRLPEDRGGYPLREVVLEEEHDLGGFEKKRRRSVSKSFRKAILPPRPRQLTCFRASTSRDLHPNPSRSRRTVACVAPRLGSIVPMVLSSEYVSSLTVSSTVVRNLSWFLARITQTGPPLLSLSCRRKTFRALRLSFMSASSTFEVLLLHIT